jgi:hypothetical protein
MRLEISIFIASVELCETSVGLRVIICFTEFHKGFTDIQ